MTGSRLLATMLIGSGAALRVPLRPRMMCDSSFRSPMEPNTAGLNDALLSLACCQTAAECLALSQDVELNPTLPQDVCKERLVSNVEHTLPKCWCEMRESLLAWAPLTIIRRPTPDIG